jgi:hypothetical protein
MLNELIEQVDSFFDTVDGKHVGRVAWSRIKSEYLELAHLSGKAQAYADVLDMLNSEYVEVKNYSPASPVQQIKAEIALLLNTWDNTTKQQFLDTWVLRINKLRQLSAV